MFHIWSFFFLLLRGLIAVWLRMVIITSYYYLSPWYQQMCNQVGSEERRFSERKKMDSELLPLIATTIINSWSLIRCCMVLTFGCLHPSLFHQVHQFWALRTTWLCRFVS